MMFDQFFFNLYRFADPNIEPTRFEAMCYLFWVTQFHKSTAWLQFSLHTNMAGLCLSPSSILYLNSVACGVV